MKQLGQGDENVNVLSVQNWYPSQVQGFLHLGKNNNKNTSILSIF